MTQLIKSSLFRVIYNNRLTEITAAQYAGLEMALVL